MCLKLMNCNRLPHLIKGKYYILYTCRSLYYRLTLKVVKRKRYAFIFYTVEDVIKVSVVPVVTKSEGKLTKVGVALLPLGGQP